MPYVPCRECRVVVPYAAAACGACRAPRPGAASPDAAPAARHTPRLPLVLAAALVLGGAMVLGACGKAPPDPRREKYEADRARCEAGSTDEGARKSCMVYRGWPDGKFK